MEQEVREHKHPISEAVVYGQKLEPGDVLLKNDVYSADTGKWAITSFHGHTLDDRTLAVFIRPER